MAGINPSELTELRTLGEIVSYVAPKGATAVAIEGVNTTAAPVIETPAPVQAVTEETPQASNTDTTQLEKMLLEVVSEKTGYPAEMLEMNMDMEADLGIDSIKRVEIFGALTKQYPSMAGINPSELTELRTLGEIVNYVAPKGAATPTTAATLANNAAVANKIVNTTATLVNETAAPVQSTIEVEVQENDSYVDNTQLEKMLLTVVSEKTGYPAEMLEMNMDMEADLGIDSIKRVEIFGALTKQYPDMSDINPSELTELRTLGEIVDYVSTSSKKKNPLSIAKPVAQDNNEYITTGKFHKVERNNIGLKYLPQADFMEFSLPDTHLTLVTNEGSALTSSVVKQLENKGHQVLVLNLPGTTMTPDTRALSLTAHTDEAIKNAIEEIHSKYGKIGSFIHLHPHFEFQNGNFTQHFKADKDIVKTVFFLAKHLQQDLNDLGQTQRANFVTVSRLDGILGLGKRGNVSVIGGGLPGLVKCLNLEWSPVKCRAVDIQPELPIEKISAQVIAELHDANSAIIEVAYSEEGRKTTSVIPDPVPEEQKIKTTITKDSVFLVSGGAKGVTANCVIEMAKTFQCKFILLGRSNFNVEIPNYAKNGVDDSTLKRNIMNDLKEKSKKPSLPIVQSIFGDIVAKKEIDHTIAQVEKHGGKVVYLKGDVNNLKASQAELNKITAQLGQITGIIHGAGRLADKYIQDKTEEDFENVISVKLNGLLSLLSVVDIDKLDHLVMFSSVAGFYGNLGQSDYAIANEILSKAAHLFKTNHPHTQVSAINWGAWDSGMVSDELKVMFKAAGIKLVNSTGGAAMMVNEFNTEYAHQAQVIIGGTLPEAVSHHNGDLRNYRIKRNLKLADNPFLMHHVIQGNAVLPVVNAVGWMSQACESIYPDFKVFQITDTKLFKGIVFDGQQPEDYVIELKEVEKSAEKIVFEATILSEGKKLPTYHYRTGVTLMHKDKVPQAPKFNHTISGNYPATDGSILYKDGSLFHDKYFQGIEKIIDWNEKQIVLTCKAPEVPLSEQGQFAIQSINTFFADIQYQGMVVWVQKYQDGAMSLPLQTKTATLYKPVPFGKELMVNVTIQEASEFKIVALCTVYDEDGTVYMQTDGAAVTVSKQLVW
ncbi:SDR family NAD(P)-dependent oxidoreductase, partial [Lentimicrobium sp. L6]|uniref:SDR family NAD(P)-dependent oxidoreductase n=1 Tax=Lentimicrobium sp. L6 TaxID=2735916 RepID=UPI001554108C